MVYIHHLGRHLPLYFLQNSNLLRCLRTIFGMLTEIYNTYKEPIFCVAGSWFGNNGLWAPVRKELGDDIHLVSRLRSNKVVWVYRKTQWVALFTTDLSLSVKQIIEYYGARWKIESGFKELKQDIGSLERQCRNAHAVVNHLNFCMMATSLTWIYAMQFDKAPKRRHLVNGRHHFAFSDVRRHITEAVLTEDFPRFCSREGNSALNSIAQAAKAMLRMAA